MEATVLLKVLEETDRHTLSFDMDDFDFLWHTASAAFYWEERHEGRFEESMDDEPPTTVQKGWNMYWVDERIECPDCVQDRPLSRLRSVSAMGYGLEQLVSAHRLRRGSL